MALDQANRFLNFHSPLGENALVLSGFRGEESISRLFRFELDLLSEDVNIKPSDIIGQNVSFSIRQENDERRFFNGFVNRFSTGDEDDKQHRNYSCLLYTSDAADE